MRARAERRASGRRRRRPALRRRAKALTASRQNPAVAEGDRPVVDSDRDGDAAAVAAAAKAKRPVPKRKGALAVALAASVAIPAIVVLNWPRSAPQPVVEPGMLAEGQTKLMAPSAALATAPPREAPNVSRDRPLVHETRGDELNEIVSFKRRRQGGRSDAESRRGRYGAVRGHGASAEGGARLQQRRRADGRAPRQRIRPPRQAPLLRSPPKRRRRPRSTRRRRSTSRGRRVPSGHAAALGADAKRCRPRPRPAGGRFAVGTRSWRGREDRSATGRSGDRR